MLSLTELTRRVDLWKGTIPREKRWELCSACPMQDCDIKSKTCGVRMEVRRRQRERYAKNPETYRKWRRNSHLSPERIEHKRKERQAYYVECKDVIQAKAVLRRATDPEKYRAKEKHWRDQRKLKQQEVTDNAT